MSADHARTYPRIAPRRSGTVRTEWARGWRSAVEESAYEDRDLKRGMALARAGAVGQLTVTAGLVVAAVTDGEETYGLRVELPLLDPVASQTLVEVVGSGAGWIGALLAGTLPEAFVEATEEAGVELLPYGGEFDAVCACEAWAQPCRHAIAVLTQVSWLMEAEPLVLVHVRGLARPELLEQLQPLVSGDPEEMAEEEMAEEDADLVPGIEAAEEATAMLGDFTTGDGPPGRA
ncbi:SWIM zinc finger family protein [Nocardioides gilvus]|uniref:SWIM zinc finger family protein n=1 Tax=Nocardioides gilvus TaxID=1735589 RepID=UPI000D74DD21|nr:SWIM zinc finger family protein [Nocardioides gilvus]